MIPSLTTMYNNFLMTRRISMAYRIHCVYNWKWDGPANFLSRLFLILMIFSGFQTSGFSLDSRTNPQALMLSTPSPYLELAKYNTTVFLGQSAYLPCVVKFLGDKTVSWIRKRDLHILTSGTQVYTNDKRFSLLREGKLQNAWTLKISSITKKDEGTFECQINTEPKLTAYLHLIVLGSNAEDPGSAALASVGMLDSPHQQRDDHRSNNGYEAKILGPTKWELEQGQIANFTCIISNQPSGTPPNVSWYMNEIPIQKHRGGFSVSTEKSSHTTISQLVILKVDKRDEGKYSCGGMTIYPDSVVLKVRPHHSNSQNSMEKRWRKDDINSCSGISTYPFWLLPVICTSIFMHFVVINQ